MDNSRAATEAPTEVDAYSLHGHLASLRDSHPEEVLDVERPLDIKFGLTALFNQLEGQQRFPVMVVHRPEFEGRPLSHPIVTGLYSSRVRLARLMGTDPFRVSGEYARRLTRAVPPVVTTREEAPVKAVVERETEVDIRRFPAPWHHPMDPGRYLSAGFLTTYDPDTGIENSSIQRGWMKDRDEIRVFLQATSHNHHIFQKYESRGQAMPVAYWVGHHPLYVMGCESRSRLNHWEAAGAIAERPLRLVPSESLGPDFLVPADAEVVIEGYILPGERRPEGPFGEYPQYYGPQHLNPVMRVTAATYRRDAHWDTVMVGHVHWLAGFQREGAALDNIKRTVPQVLNVYIPQSGCQGFHIYVQIRQTGPGQARSALLAALNVDPLIKHAFVFDEDVDIFNDREVLWALATRFQGDQDVLVMKDLLGPSLDPSSPAPAIGCKTGFDCTRGVPAHRFATRLTLPGEAVERFQLADYVSAGRLSDIPRDPLS